MNKRQKRSQDWFLYRSFQDAHAVAMQAAHIRRNGPDGYVILNNGSPNPKPRLGDGRRKILYSTGETAA